MGLALLSARAGAIHDVRLAAALILGCLVALYLVGIADWGAARPPRRRRWKQTRRTW